MWWLSGSQIRRIQASGLARSTAEAAGVAPGQGIDPRVGPGINPEISPEMEPGISPGIDLCVTRIAGQGASPAHCPNTHRSPPTLGDDCGWPRYADVSPKLRLAGSSRTCKECARFSAEVAQNLPGFDGPGMRPSPTGCLGPLRGAPARRGGTSRIAYESGNK